MNTLLHAFLPLFLSASFGGATPAAQPCDPCNCCPPACCANGCCDDCCPPGCCR